ncbi:MAG: hypothetical protein HC837_01495 [Chloroflexaceae bacterium]|nr:hypothetical protein [Chloroflexaceae bacterium]
MSHIHDVLSIAPRYTRAVHIEHDFAVGTQALAGYQATPLVLQTLGRLLEGLHPTATARAFSLTGVYGTGKSAFGLFLAHYLSSSPERRQQLLEQHQTVPLGDGLIYDGPRLLPVLLSGNNASLRSDMLQALYCVLQQQSDVCTHEPDLLETLTRMQGDANLDAQHVADVIAQTNQRLVQHTSYDGILLLIDELGQYLEYAFYQNTLADLFVLQACAEMAARSAQPPCLLVTILHQAFDQYAAYARVVQQSDWQKIAGRFEDIPFQEPDSQMLCMVGHALCPDTADVHTLNRQAWMNRFAVCAETLALRPSSIDPATWERLLAQTCPIHPLVLRLLPHLFRQFAQNERSLFSFLTSQEPCGVADFLASYRCNGAYEPIYRLPDLYAYVEANMGTGLYTRSRGRRWAELTESLARVQTIDPLHHDVLMTIGVLNVFGQQQAIRASKPMISFALRDCDDDPEITQVLQQFIDDQLIVYRHYSDSYMLWEGSDLDLDTLVQEATRRIGGQTDIAALLQQSIEPVPLVARKHSYQTGTVRHFAVRFVTVDGLTTMTPTTVRADGEILYIVPSDHATGADIQEWIRHANRTKETHRIAVLPSRVQRLDDLLLEVTALRQILETQPELEHDRVARRELASRLTEAQHALDQAVAWSYYPGHSTWWWCGQEQSVTTTRDRDHLLSRACDATYHAAPRVWNELIVRRQLSSASAKARRNLVEAMLDHGYQAGLSFEGYPPERAIYESIFLESGIHREEQDDRWGFGPPDPVKDASLHLTPAWNALQNYLNAAQREPQPIRQLFALLEAPPYGVKAGVIPLLFVAVYLANAGEIILYEHGNYITVPDIAVFERLMRQPGYFSLRQSRTGGARMAVYERLAQKLAQYALSKTVQPALLDAINPLLRLVHHLPEYSRHTGTISAPAQGIRQALLTAREPDIALFETLPRACGVDPFTAETPFNETQFETFFAALRNGLLELQEAYPNLVNDVAERIRAAFGANASDHAALHEELSLRCQGVTQTTTDHQIRALSVRLQNTEPGDGWIERVGALVAQKPMSSWRDDDRQRFNRSIVELGHRFCQTERVTTIIRQQQASTPTLQDTVDALDPLPTVPDTPDRLPTVPDHPGMQQLQIQIQRTLDTQSETLNDAQRVTVLWEILQALIERTNERKPE